MFDKLEDILYRYEEVLKELSEPEVLNDTVRYQRLMKEQAELEPVVAKYKEYKEKKAGYRNVPTYTNINGSRNNQGAICAFFPFFPNFTFFIDYLFS